MIKRAKVDYFAVLAGPPLRAQTLAGRREMERERKRKSSDRKNLKSGRTVQMNLRVRAEMKAEIKAYAEREGTLPVEVVERAWAAFILSSWLKN